MNIQNSPSFKSAFLVQCPANRSAINRLIKDSRERDENINLYESPENPYGEFIVKCDDKNDEKTNYYLKNEFMPGKKITVTKFDTVI